MDHKRKSAFRRWRDRRKLRRIELLERKNTARTTLRDYRDALGGEGSHQHELDCYGRAGEPCPRCATERCATSFNHGSETKNRAYSGTCKHSSPAVPNRIASIASQRRAACRPPSNGTKYQ